METQDQQGTPEHRGQKEIKDLTVIQVRRESRDLKETKGKRVRMGMLCL
jgi:hypothetical protein